jgi:hypothetical protein
LLNALDELEAIVRGDTRRLRLTKSHRESPGHELMELGRLTPRLRAKATRWSVWMTNREGRVVWHDRVGAGSGLHPSRVRL